MVNKEVKLNAVNPAIQRDKLSETAFNCSNIINNLYIMRRIHNTEMEIVRFNRSIKNAVKFDNYYFLD